MRANGFLCVRFAGQGGPMVTAHGHQGSGGDREAIDLALGRGGRCETSDLPMLFQFLLLCDVYALRFAVL
jgi:hypothetical protein